jgi:hypothetical protein
VERSLDRTGNDHGIEPRQPPTEVRRAQGPNGNGVRVHNDHFKTQGHGLLLAIATPSIRVCSALAIPAPHRPLALLLAHAARGPSIGSVMRIDGPIICTIDQTPEREGTRMSTSHSSHS